MNLYKCRVSIYKIKQTKKKKAPSRWAASLQDDI